MATKNLCRNKEIANKIFGGSASSLDACASRTDGRKARSAMQRRKERRLRVKRTEWNLGKIHRVVETREEDTSEQVEGNNEFSVNHIGQSNARRRSRIQKFASDMLTEVLGNAAFETLKASYPMVIYVMLRLSN